MAVRSRRFFGPLDVAPGGASVILVPPGRTAIIRSILFTNDGSTTVSWGIMYRDSAVPGYTPRAILRGTVAGSSSTSVTTPIILNPGDELILQTYTLGLITGSGYGSLLEGAPA